MAPHHIRENSELRVTVSFPEGTPIEEQAESLNELMLTLKQKLGLNERLTRLPGLQQQVGPLRIFVFEFQDPIRVAAMLHAVGGWYMRHADYTLTLRADAPAGGMNLQLKEFSTVAFAQAAVKIAELVGRES